MIISGANISMYGLRRLKIKGENDLPARKKILREWGFDANDIRFRNKEVEVILLGKYPDQQTLAANIEGLKTLLHLGKLPFEFPNLDISFTGYCEKGMKVEIFKNVARCTLKITVD